jgi:hypothetical protein
MHLIEGEVMKILQKWMGILCVAIAAASLLAACGDTEDSKCGEDSNCMDEETLECTSNDDCNIIAGETCDLESNTCEGGNSCRADSDCAAGDLCNFATGTCAIQCTNDPTMCIAGETCTPRGAGDEGSICVVEPPECTKNDDCDAAAGEICDLETNTCVVEDVPECTTSDECDVAAGEICSDGQCVPNPAPPHFFAKIADISSGCDPNSSDPGSDLFGVELHKDSFVYYAEVVGANIQNQATNENPVPDVILDGHEPELAGACPAQFTGSVVSLGCGGDVVVKFVDDVGNTIEIEDGDLISPLEWGGQCTGGASSDAWEVLICDSSVSATDLIFDTSACNGASIGTGQGIGTVTVVLP